MKKIVIILLSVLALASCGKQDTVYKEFVKPGGYIYPAKPIELTATSGYQKVILEWGAPMDPSVRFTRLFWDNYTDSLEFSISDYVDGALTAIVSDLDDRSYTFDVINYDGKGHKSLATEITTTPFGESWLLSHAERSLMAAAMDGDEAVITMSKSTDEMVATKFRYKTVDGKVIESGYLKPGETEMRLPNALKGKKFEYKSAFLPSSGTDTVWFASWQKSQFPILYKLDVENWTVEATKGQVYSTYTANKIFDGVISSSNRWHSSRTASTAKLFPKVLAIDTKEEGDAAASLVKMVFSQSPSGSTYRYIREVQVFVGDKPYDPNDSAVLENYGTPALVTTLGRNDADQTVEFKPAVKGRYIAVVFTNSYNTSGYIDLWELAPYGYVVSDAD